VTHFPCMEQVMNGWIREHGAKVERHCFGNSASICNDMMDAMERAWERLAGEIYEMD
jgi:hypothetical protein